MLRAALIPTVSLQSAEWTDGYPRWRVVLGTLTQLVVFPVIFLAWAFGRQAPPAALGLALPHTHAHTRTPMDPHPVVHR